MSQSQEITNENDESILQELTNSFDSQGTDTSDLISPEKPVTWVGSHYSIEIDEGVRKRVCKAEGCDVKYHFGASHLILRKHWLLRHTDVVTADNRNKIRFHESDYLDALYRWIIRGKQVYSTLSDPDFRNFISILSPSKPLPNRNVIHDVILNQMVHNQKVIIEMLKEALSIATTFDMWTSRTGHGFGCLTAHYYGKSETLKSVILEFKKIPHPHDGPSIFQFIKETLKTFKITRKIISLTTDNASNNIVAVNTLVDELGLDGNFEFGFLKFRCTAHIINLAVNKALTELRISVSAIRNIVLIINSSSKRIQDFQQIQQQLGRKTTLKLKEDVTTRWNSTYLMIERALELQDEIDQALLEMTDLDQLNPINWHQLREIAEFLGPFNDLTTNLSAEKHPSISIVMAANRTLMRHLNNEWTDEVIKKAAAAFRVKLEEYEGYLDQPVAVMAAVLDPRLKLDCFDTVAHGFARELLAKHVGAIRVDTEAVTATSSFMSSLFVRPSSDELESYLGEPRCAGDCNVSQYWYSNATKYPKLSKLARTILNIQATSVACERANSRAGLIDTPHRGRLDEESLRSNVLLYSWLNLSSPRK